jgi:hypothetical protein
LRGRRTDYRDILILHSIIHGTTVKLENIANVCVIGAVLIFCGTSIYDRIIKPKVRDSQSPVLAGRAFKTPVSPLKAKKPTIILAVSSSCHFCDQSMDFYRRLANQNSQTCEANLIAIGPSERENRAEIGAYLSVSRLVVDQYDVMNFKQAGIAGTPTLLLLDSTGVARSVWVGKLPEGQQSEVLSRLRSTCN